MKKSNQPNQSSDASRYAARGVSSNKGGVHKAIVSEDKGLFPGAFCIIMPDIAGDPDYCYVVHADGAGTKSLLPYLIKNEKRFDGRNYLGYSGTAIDAAVMNLDDLASIGAVNNFYLVNIIGRNAKLITNDDVSAVIAGYRMLAKQLEESGIKTASENRIKIHRAGGETADIGDLVRTITVDSVVTVRMKREDVIDCSRMRPGDVIVGFSSTGQTTYEYFPNSSMGSNGLTSSRHDTLCKEYKYEETYAPQVPDELIYCGKYKLSDPLPGDPRFTIGSALASPTRTYLPLIRALIEKLPHGAIHGLIHCSGGGQTKIGKFGQEGNLYVIDKPFPVPPIFKLLAKASGKDWREMYQVYNMGWRMEAVLPKEWAKPCIRMSRDFGIDAKIVGHVSRIGKKAKDSGIVRQVKIRSHGKKLAYDFKE
jgi:phosphoribosylformylglycinamidine cyclo-ligase